MHLRSVIVALGFVALTATVALASHELPAQADAGLTIAAGKAAVAVPADDLDQVPPAFAQAGANAANGDESGGNGDGASALNAQGVEVPEDFGELVSTFAQENAGDEPGIVADQVLEWLGIEPGANAADAADGAGPPEGIPDLSGLPDAAPDLSGVPAGPPEDLGRP